MLPFVCAFCGLDTDVYRVCHLCRAVLPRIESPCERCGQALPQSQPAGVQCADCQRRPPAFTRARAPFHYAFPVDHGLKQLKYHGQLIFAPAFAELLLPLVADEFPNCDALAPVPLHRWRHLFRGFNQADEICRLLAQHTGLPVIRSIVRHRATASQSGLSKAARNKNIRGAFSMQGNSRYRFPLIVDDVITTGATSNQLVKVLRGAGADRVGVLAVARSGDR